MGASDFCTTAKGKTAREAFRNAVEDARYEYGHGGYTGTIAEKHECVLIPLPSDKNPERYAYELINACDARIDDKWGPAGCFDLGNGEFMFFGVASS
jgi:hypothetical protein